MPKSSLRIAAEWLKRRVQDKQVELEPITQDRYDRLVARVFVGELDVNAELVRLGHAWAYRKYMRKGEDAGLCSLEQEARESRLGLWAISTQARVAPWDWRRRKQQVAADYGGETIAHCVAAIGS